MFARKCGSVLRSLRSDCKVVMSPLAMLSSKMSYKVQKITESMLLGESPHWDAATQSLFFVDVHGNMLNKYEFATGKHTKTKFAEGRPGFLVPVEDKPSQFLIGMERKFVIVQWDGADGSKPAILQELGEVDQHEPTNRINDGKADPRGRIYAGTMGLRESPDVYRLEKAALFRIDSCRGGKIEQLEDRISTSNGLAWDLQEKAFYYCDSVEAKVRRYNYDVDTGDICNKTYIFDLRNNNCTGFPDGCTVDTDGNLWIALFRGSAVIQVDPRTSKLLRSISLPVKQVASVTFGGPELDILFVTTGNMPSHDQESPLSGCTFMLTGLGVKGHPNAKFKL